MCDFFSAIITRNNILYIPGNNSHADIVDKYGLDDTTPTPDFVRCELLPIDSNIFNHNLENWKLSYRGDFLPSWFVAKDAELMMKQEVKKAWNELFFINMNSGKLIIKNKDTVYIYRSTCRLYNVNKAIIYGKSIVALECGCNAYAFDNSEVTVNGGSRVSAYDKSIIKAYGYGSVVFANEHSQVNAYGNSIVIACDDSSVSASGDSIVDIPCSKHVKIVGIYDNAIVRDGYYGKILTNTSHQICAYDNKEKVPKQIKGTNVKEMC